MQLETAPEMKPETETAEEAAGFSRISDAFDDFMRAFHDYKAVNAALCASVTVSPRRTSLPLRVSSSMSRPA